MPIRGTAGRGHTGFAEHRKASRGGPTAGFLADLLQKRLRGQQQEQEAGRNSAVVQGEGDSGWDRVAI